MALFLNCRPSSNVIKSEAPAQTKARSKSDLEWKDVPGPLNFDSFSTDSGVGSVATDTSQVL